MKNLIPIGLLISLAGCAEFQVVVVRDTPPASPSFTVIPAAYSEGEIAFAARVERAIARTGLRVLERPAFKFMETDAVRTDSASSGSAVGGGNWAVGGSVGTSISKPVKVTDIVAMYADSPAEYIVATYWNSGTIRIVKKQDRLLVASEQFRGYSESQDAEDISLSKSVYSALLYGGFVKEKYDELRCQLMPGPGPKKDYSAYYK